MSLQVEGKAKSKNERAGKGACGSLKHHRGLHVSVATQLRDESGDLAVLHVREISTQTIYHTYTFTVLERVVFLPRTLPLVCFAPTFLLASRLLVITLSDSVVLSSLECQKFRIIQHAAFSNWLSVPQHICLSAYRRTCWWLFWFGALVLDTSVYRLVFCFVLWTYTFNSFR